jgi:hypothetical protein
MKFIRAIYDKTLYQEALTEKFSKPFFYWVIMSLVSLFLINISLGWDIYKALPSLEELKQEIPYFEIEEGILDVEQREEIYIEETPALIIIDDEYTFSAEEFKYTPQYLVATKEIVYIKGEDSELREVSYNDYEWLRNTDRDTLINNIMDILPTEAVAVVIGSILLFVLFVNVLVLMFKFIPILLWAAVGLISSKIFKKDLTYGESVKIMLYGNTLPTIITTIYWVVFKDNINMFTFFLLVSIYTGYFIYQLNTGEIQKEGITDTVTPTQDTNPLPTQTPTPPETVETIRPIQQSQPGMENIQKEAVVSNLEEENK